MPVDKDTDEELIALAKTYAPDYPYTQHTVRETIWALGETRTATQAVKNLRG